MTEISNVVGGEKATGNIANNTSGKASDKRYFVHTFGCKVNTYDTGLLQKRLLSQGFERVEEGSAIHILNTCAVTAEATKDAVRTIRQIKNKNPLAKVVVTGCGAQVDSKSFTELKEADLIVANSHKGLLGEIINKHLKGESSERLFHSNIFRKEDLEEDGGIEEDHTRAFLKIQDGCNQFCTYCVIPFARGKSRSISPEVLTAKINEFHARGIREVVLTGVHIGDYEWGLENLVERVLNETSIERIRLTSLEPIEVTPKLLDLYSNPRLCRHFHMSIQSAQTKVLREMKRNYTSDEVEWALTEIQKRVPGAFVGMDVIVGFPGETEEEFQETYSRLERLPWTRIHVFPYSQRPGTRASVRLDQVQTSSIKQRAQKLRDLSSERYAHEALKQLGTVKKVLVLTPSNESGRGLSEDYWPVAIDLNKDEVGHEIPYKVIGFDQSNPSRINGFLVGQRI